MSRLYNVMTIIIMLSIMLFSNFIANVRAHSTNEKQAFEVEYVDSFEQIDNSVSIVELSNMNQHILGSNVLHKYETEKKYLHRDSYYRYVVNSIETISLIYRLKKYGTFRR